MTVVVIIIFISQAIQLCPKILKHKTAPTHSLNDGKCGAIDGFEFTKMKN